MSLTTGIDWTDSTWNPLRGCSHVSEGCHNCYAERMAARFSGPGKPYENVMRTGMLTTLWNGQVELVEKHLLDPLKWGPVRLSCAACGADHLMLNCPEKITRPRHIFVNSMSDLFHENVTDEMRDQIFAVMALCPQHTFQILTKRPERMLEYLSNQETAIRVLKAKSNIWQGRHQRDESLGLPRMTPDYMLLNVWLGVSVENQATANERIPLLLQTPAAVRFVSCEPLLGPVDLRLPRQADYPLKMRPVDPGIDWVICGGESGYGARPMHPDWARGLRDQCQAAGVPFFFKSWGENVYPYGDGIQRVGAPSGAVNLNGTEAGMKVVGDVGCVSYWRVGKKAAGCLLDGVEYKQFPEAR